MCNNVPNTECEVLEATPKHKLGFCATPPIAQALIPLYYTLELPHFEIHT